MRGKHTRSMQGASIMQKEKSILHLRDAFKKIIASNNFSLSQQWLLQQKNKKMNKCSLVHRLFALGETQNY